MVYAFLGAVIDKSGRRKNTTGFLHRYLVYIFPIDKAINGDIIYNSAPISRGEKAKKRPAEPHLLDDQVPAIR